MEHTENALGEPQGLLKRQRFISEVRAAADLETIASLYGRVTHLRHRTLTPCPCQLGSAAPVPSLILNQHSQTGKCWLCLTQGDVFWLVMDHEQISFRDAVRFLADRAGITEPEGVTWSASQVRQPHATSGLDSYRSPMCLQALEAPRELRI